jgi:hypothetical protein
MPQSPSLTPERSMEPIPGYRLHDRVGAGGYGEVWSCEAPGELVKAIKFVYGFLNEERASRELKALQRIKGVRHPFLLSLERIEVVDGHLIIVTELADCSLKDRFELCRQSGQPGIPRDELLSYLRDAADALDYMNEHHGLQHLDVKPENLLLVGGRIKVADFGLVKDMEETSASMMGGLTPIYAPPEVFDGRPSRRSDQYSLAIVYQEMLTGVLPFPGKTAAQLAAQHLSAQPRLNSLSPADRDVIAKALAKNPEERFANCRELVESLLRGGISAGADSSPAPAAKAEGAFSLPTPAVMKTEVGPAPAAGGPTELQGEPVRSPADMLRDADRASQTAILLGEGKEEEAEAKLRESISYSHTTATVTGEDLRAAAVAWSAPDTAREVIDLPPLECDLESWKPVPTLFVGVGGTAARTLQWLRRKLEDRYQAQSRVLFPMFLLDTDARDVMSAAHGEAGAAIASNETMILGLRKAQDYRADSSKHLEWLSRRWLYNIPRSQQTEGIRPLGRLALIDHADDVRRQLRLQVQNFLKSAAGPQNTSGIKPDEGGVRVVVIASISGATGGGAVIDVAFLMRKLLDEQKVSGDIVLVLTHGTGRQATAQQLAQVNAYVTLAELNQCLRPGGVYPGDQALKVDPRSGTAAQIQDVYLVHMGDELSAEQYQEACDRVSEFLYLDAGTPANAYFKACRQQPSEPTESCQGEFLLRSFGICRIGFAADVVLDRKVGRLCRAVVERWTGEPRRAEGKRTIRLLSPLAGTARNEAAERDAAIDARAEEETQACGLDSDSFLRHAYQAAEKELGTDALSYFRKLMWGVSRSVQGAYPVMECLSALDNLFGPRKVEVSVAALKVAPLPAAMDERISALVGQLGAPLQARIEGLAEDFSLRVYGGQRIARFVAAHLKRLAESFHEMRNQVAIQMDQLEQQILVAAGLDSRGRTKPGKTPSHVLEGMLVQYAQLRLMLLATESAAHLARGVQGFVNAAGDKLVEFAREVKCLTAYFGNDAEPEEPEQTGPSGDPLADLRRQVDQTLAEKIDSLAEGMDRQFTDNLFRPNGFRRTIFQGGQEREALVTALKREARRLLIEHVQTADVAAMVIGSQPAGAGHNPVQQLVTQSRPLLQRAGGQRRLVCVVPKGTQAGCDSAGLQTLIGPEIFSQPPALVRDSTSDLVFCFELSAVPVSHAAATIIDHRPDFAELAYRLHARSDIVWQPLPPR